MHDRKPRHAQHWVDDPSVTGASPRYSDTNIATLTQIIERFSNISLRKRDSVQKMARFGDSLPEFPHVQGKPMITEARAQIDLIATLHLETLYRARHLSAGYDSTRVAHIESAIPQSNEHDAIQLRHRLAAIQNLSLRARGLCITTDIGNAAPTRGNDAVTS